MPTKKPLSVPAGKPSSEGLSRESRSSQEAHEDALRARDIVLERIETQLRVVVETVIGLGQQMDTKLDALEARLSERLTIVEQVVRRSSEDIRKNAEDIRKLQEDVRRLQDEFGELRPEDGRRPELARTTSLEERVARVEAELGIAS